MLLLPISLFAFPFLSLWLLFSSKGEVFLSYIASGFGVITVLALFIQVAAFTVKLQMDSDIYESCGVFTATAVARVLLIPAYLESCALVLFILGIFANPFLFIVDFFLLPFAIPLLFGIVVILSALISVPAVSRIIRLARAKKITVGKCILHIVTLLILPIFGFADCIVLAVKEHKIKKELAAGPDDEAVAI